MTPIYYELSEEQRSLRTINDNAKPLPMDYAIGALFLDCDCCVRRGGSLGNGCAGWELDSLSIFIDLIPPAVVLALGLFVVFYLLRGGANEIQHRSQVDGLASALRR